jgi:hypothetical protein
LGFVVKLHKRHALVRAIVLILQHSALDDFSEL